MIKYQAEKDFILKAIQESQDHILHVASHQMQDKAIFDIVTETDLNIEKYLISQIHKHYPSDHILSEEYHASEVIKERTWTIDPIDGTFNFASQSPLFGIQCALIEAGEIVMSVIVLPQLNERYYAIKGYGAFLNDHKLNVNQSVSMQQAMISIGDYSHKRERESKILHEVVGRLYTQVARIRMYGAACIDYGFIASNKTSGTIILTSNLWDIAPGILIAKEAGAQVYNANRKPYKLGDFGSIVVSSETLKDIVFNAFDTITFK